MTSAQTQLYGIGRNVPVWLCREHAASLSKDPRLARLPAAQRRPSLRRHQPPSWLREVCLVCQEATSVAALRSRGAMVYPSPSEAESALGEAGHQARVAGIYVPWPQSLGITPAAGYVIER